MAQNRTQTNIFKGSPDGHVTANGKNLPLSNRGRKSSPTGFAWGYGGSGPYALAHSMLKHLFGEAKADQHASRFKEAVIARLNPDEGFEMPYAGVRSWVQARESLMEDVLISDASDESVTEDIDAQRDHDERMAAVMFLTPAEADFMQSVCRFDEPGEGLVLYVWQPRELAIAAKLEKGGLVTIEAGNGFAVVRAVRGEEGEG